MLEISNFRKVYNGHVALQVDAFTITPGLYWIQGVNGSGKSTLLKALAGIVPFEGDSILDGRVSLKRQSVAYRSLVNFAEAEPVFPSFLTGTELIRLFREAKGAPDRQEDFYLASMNMTAYIDDAVNTYSSGMLKKLSLVLAFLGRPMFILLDEPLTTLDTEALPILYTWIAQQRDQYGTTFLLSSHQAFVGDALPTVRPILVADKTIQYRV